MKWKTNTYTAPQYLVTIGYLFPEQEFEKRDYFIIDRTERATAEEILQEVLHQFREDYGPKPLIKAIAFSQQSDEGDLTIEVLEEATPKRRTRRSKLSPEKPAREMAKILTFPRGGRKRK